MTYTRTWDEVMALPGSRDADEIDDENREGHVDFTERFSDILYSVTADPWKVRVPGVNSDGTQNLQLGSTEFALFGTTLTRDLADVTVVPTAVSVGNNAVAFLRGPRGSTIKGVSVLVNRAAGATATMTLRRIDAAGAASDITTVSAVGTGIQTLSSAVLTEVMNADISYYLIVNLVANGSSASSAKLYQADVLFKLPGTP